jgi:gamma-glutamyltranspeptidase
MNTGMAAGLPQILTALIDHELPAADAVEAPRFGYRDVDGRTWLDPEMPEEVRTGLERRGIPVHSRPASDGGYAFVVRLDPARGTLEGAVQPEYTGNGVEEY